MQKHNYGTCIKDYMEKSIRLDRQRLQYYKKINNAIRLNGILIRKTSRKSKCIRYYYRNEKGEETYLGKNKRKTILALKRKRLAKAMIETLQQNIRTKEWFCESILDDNIEDVMAKLPKAYQHDENIEPTRSRQVPQSENPHRREDLDKRTSFGLWVRSKSEAQIAELLYSLGIEFYYEKALELEFYGPHGYDSRIFYPDFTIVLPDGSEIFWEHKGMLAKANYSERDMEKEMIYNVNNIYQPHNYMVTADGPDNNVDMESVKLLVQGWLLPRIAMGVEGYWR